MASKLKLVKVEKKDDAADEYCTPAETAFVQKVWQDERRAGVPSATVLAHPDGVTEVLGCDEKAVDVVKARLMEPELRVRGTVLPKPKRREVAGLLERQVNALVNNRMTEYHALEAVERALHPRRKRRG